MLLGGGNMASQEPKSPAAEEPHAKVGEVFAHEAWQACAEHPGVLEDIGRKLDVSLSTKGQGLKDYIDDLKLAYTMLRDPNFSVDKQTRIVLIIAFLYLISPIDLLPDSLPLIGLLDDVLVAGYAIKQTAAELERYRQSKRDAGAS
jgi:uncharacterized membrane protein YkvA (DUF1232 family)